MFTGWWQSLGSGLLPTKKAAESLCMHSNNPSDEVLELIDLIESAPTVKSEDGNIWHTIDSDFGYTVNYKAKLVCVEEIK